MISLGNYIIMVVDGGIYVKFLPYLDLVPADYAKNSLTVLARI